VKPALVLTGALFTGAASLAAGLILFQRLSLKLYRQEIYPYAFVVGSAIYSLIIFLLAAAGILSTWTIVPAGTLLIGLATWKRSWRRTGPSLPKLPRLWAIAFAATLAAYGTVYLAYAMAPEASPDGSSYHLGLVARYLRQHGFGTITTNMYANISMGIEMLFLSAFSIGRHSAASVVHFLFLMALPLVMLAFARRYNMPGTGVTAALLVFCSPVIGQDGSVAYIDIGMAATVVCCFCFLQIWAAERDRKLLVPLGLLTGFAYACKLTAFVAVPYVIGFVLYKLVRSRQPILRPLLITSACAGLMIAPWIVKNLVTIGNPFSPFFNRWFPNPYVRIALEEEYTRGLRIYPGIQTASQVPAELTIRGGWLNGLLGPVFILAPAALLAARWPMGRQMLLAAAVFGSTYPANIGTRFLIGALPFLSFALALVLTQWRVAGLVVAFHVLMSWPYVVPFYADGGAWRIDGFRLDEALRKKSEDTFLRDMLPGYAMAQLVNQHVPRNGKVLTYQGVAEAYSERDILTCYQAGLNNLLCEIWASGTEYYFLPARHWNFKFPEVSTRKMRLVQTADNTDVWGVSELRFFGPRGEIARAGNWRLKAYPNPWDVQLAFDNCPTTRWKAWQRAEPGQFVETDFGEQIKLSGAVASIAGDNPLTAGRVDVEIAGRWQTVAEKAHETPVPPPTNSRRNAIEDLKRFGITHLVVDSGDFLQVDMFRNRSAWGITLIGETSNARLYRLD
jgi:hypothetical protein